MPIDGDGRRCDRCQLRVIDSTKLDADEIAALGRGNGRVCARFELSEGRPRAKLGLAAAVVVVTLAGCATPIPAQPSAPDISWSDLVAGQPEGRGVIAGVIRDEHGEPAANALVILMSTALPQERELWTRERGVYLFGDLPPGNYTIQVLFGKANVSKITTLAAGGQLRANFSVDSQADAVIGMVVCDGDRVIDPTTASSTYSSKMVEIP